MILSYLDKALNLRYEDKFTTLHSVKPSNKPESFKLASQTRISRPVAHLFSTEGSAQFNLEIFALFIYLCLKLATSKILKFATSKNYRCNLGSPSTIYLGVHYLLGLRMMLKIATNGNKIKQSIKQN